MRPEQATERALRADVALLGDMHRGLREAIAGMTDRDLRRISPGATVRNFDLIAGIIAHDVYHAGQIQLLKKLAPRSPR